LDGWEHRRLKRASRHGNGLIVPAEMGWFGISMAKKSKLQRSMMLNSLVALFLVAGRGAVFLDRGGQQGGGGSHEPSALQISMEMEGEGYRIDLKNISAYTIILDRNI